ncbi:MAG TPA: hypothetical protein VHB02_09665 [Acidimicrobiales bacterium]|nr:hypothetical protein [Acidimicrobiales bacterium]
MTDTAPKQPRPLEITAGAEPIKLGSMLLTVVEPHRGHEVAYNRWYERDHFYAGCMIGPYQFAGRRFVATADLKAMRSPDPSAITGEPARGSYVAVYWVLDGYHDIWNRWAVRQVRALHAAGRMFDARDHVHTLLYKFAWEHRRDADGVPVELALDHPYKGFVSLWIDRADDATPEELEHWLRNQHLPSLLPGTDADLVAAFTPLPLLIDAPGDVPRQDATDRRLLLLWFLNAHPSTSWETVVLEHQHQLADSGLGTVVAALPFIPTIVGTDTYTDQLWD